MSVKRHLGSLATATGLVLAAWGVGGVANAADPFTLSSATFKDGTMMPKKVANKNPQNPNCVGDNVSPRFSWTNPPDGTKSFVSIRKAARRAVSAIGSPTGFQRR